MSDLKPPNADAVKRHLTGMLYTLETDLAELRRLWGDPSDTNLMRKRIFNAFGTLRSKIEGAIVNIQAEHRR